MMIHRMNMAGLVVVLALLLPLVVIGQTNGLISDAVIVPADYGSFKPADQVGSSYVDPAFGTRVFRMTNSGLAHSAAQGGYFGNSEICYFNIDGSYFIASENIIDNGTEIIGSFLYNGINGSRIKYLGTDTMRPWWIRWALANKYKKNGQYVSFDPMYCFYKYEGNELRLYDVRNLSSYVLLHKFSEYTEIGAAGGEGDISDDGRYWCLDGDKREMFVYDLIDDIKYPVSTFDLGTLGSQGNATGVDYAAVSPTGRYVIVSWTTEAAEAQYHGIEVYDKQWNYERQIYPGIIHWAVGTDAFGHEVVYTVAGFSIPEFFTSRGVEPGDVISIRLSDGYIRLLKHMDPWAPQVMTACNSKTNGAYLYVSFWPRSDDPSRLWAPFWGEIVEIPTDGSGEVLRLVHHRSREVAGKPEKYWQPDAVINRQGTKIVFRSTFIGSTGDLYMFDVGSRSGSSSDVTPPNSPTGLSSPAKTFNSIHLEWTRPDPASDGDYASFYRVLRNDVLIAEVFSTAYTDTLLEEAVTYKYDVYAIDNGGLQSLSPATAFLSTLSDLIPPSLQFVRIRNRTQISVAFSEAVEELSAEQAANYGVSGGVEVQSATLQSDSVTVVLQTSQMQLGVEYQLTVQGVSDLSRNHNTIPSGTSFVFRFLADFFDGFDDGVANNWYFLHPERWTVQSDEGDYALFLREPNYESPSGKLLGEYALIEQSQFFSSEFEISCSAKSAENLVANPHADYAIVYAFVDSLNYNYIQFHPYDIAINQIVNGTRTFLSKHAIDIALDQYQQIGIQMKSETLSVFLNGQKVFSQDQQGSVPGQIGLGSFNDMVYFDNVNLEAIAPVDTTPPAAPRGLVVQSAP